MIKLTFVNGHHIVDSVKYGSPSTWGAIEGDINEQRDLSLLLDKVKQDNADTREQLSTKADKEHLHLLKDITDYEAPDLSTYATKEEIPNLDGYATEQWVTNKNYLTSHQSLEDYYTKTESDDKYALKANIPSLNGYATEEWVNSKGYLTSHQDLTDYARKAEIKTVNGHSLIGSGDIQIEVGSSVDLSNYYTKTDSDGKYALKRDIPSLNGYATEQWVEGKNYLTSHQSLEEYAKKTEIPSLNGYATEQWVTEKNYLTSHQSLEDYYTKTDSDGKYALKTEIQELPKFKTVNGQAITGSTDDITITPDLSNYYKKSETSGATEIRDALANKQDYNENYVTSDQLANYATTSYVNSELGLKANATDIPTNTIELTFTLTDGTQITKTFYIQL